MVWNRTRHIVKVCRYFKREGSRRTLQKIITEEIATKTIRRIKKTYNLTPTCSLPVHQNESKHWKFQLEDFKSLHTTIPFYSTFSKIFKLKVKYILGCKVIFKCMNLDQYSQFKKWFNVKWDYFILLGTGFCGLILLLCFGWELCLKIIYFFLTEFYFLVGFSYQCYHWFCITLENRFSK